MPPYTPAPLPSCCWKGKAKGARRRDTYRGGGLALSRACLPTSRGSSLKGFKVPGCGSCCCCCCRITELPTDPYGKAEGEGASELTCVNSQMLRPTKMLFWLMMICWVGAEANLDEDKKKKKKNHIFELFKVEWTRSTETPLEIH